MFTTLGLFKQISCSAPKCARINCPFSHVPVKSLALPVDDLKSLTGSDQTSSQPAPVTGIKRLPSPIPISRPAKLPRIDNAGPSRPLSTVASTRTSSSGSTASFSRPSSAPSSVPQGPPKLMVNPSQSKIPYATRQALITTLYAAFKDLYHKFHESHPELAHDDTLAQEAEVYAKTNKQSYKIAMISSIASVKKRPIPDGPTHLSVGSEAARTRRALELQAAPKEYILKLEDVEPLIMNEETMRLYGMPMEIPSVPGGTQPSSYGEEKKCERCGQNAIIMHDRNKDACLFHWGRPIRTTSAGITKSIYGCCSAAYPSSPGCQTGPHVFTEKNIEELHIRHAFTLSSRIDTPSALEVATIDCEGVYTTQGMSVARVSVCDSDGKLVFDEPVRPDDGVEVIDFNTRFSGVTSLADAALDLNGIRRALDKLIGPRTVIVGHGIENDLLMLRMIHHRVVDTVVLFPHQRGLPFKRALRILAKEYLNRSIQTGDETVGHSASEDALATLDLLKYYVQDKNKRKGQAGR